MHFCPTHNNIVTLDRKDKKETGSKLLIALNICDLLICFFSAALTPAYNKNIQEQHVLYENYFISNSTPVNDIFKAVRNYIPEYRALENVLFVPYQFLIQSSCLVTLLLSATRMIALVNPLYTLKRKLLGGFLLISSVYLFCMAIGKFFLLKRIQDENYSDESILKGIKLFTKEAVNVKWEFSAGYKTLFYMQMVEFAIVAVIVIIVAVCSGLTVKSLRCPAMTEVTVDSGNERSDSHNRRASIMILLLSFIFVLINGSWIATILMLNIEVIKRVEQAKVVEMTFITLILMPVNSVANPLIYISRNSALKEYTRSSVMKLRRYIFRY